MFEMKVVLPILVMVVLIIGFLVYHYQTVVPARTYVSRHGMSFVTESVDVPRSVNVERALSRNMVYIRVTLSNDSVLWFNTHRSFIKLTERAKRMVVEGRMAMFNGKYIGLRITDVEKYSEVRG